MRTVFCHFYNEEYLLPFWLKHHREIFDHGVMIDYASTDASADIIRTLTPGWKLVRSVNEFFDAVECNFEVMLHEHDYEGWKIALNVTEFLCAASLRAVEERIKRDDVMGAYARGVIMAEPPGVSLDDPDSDKPLVAQRQFGYFEDDLFVGGIRLPIKPTYCEKRWKLVIKPSYMGIFKQRLGRCRLYHNQLHGAYAPGRHRSLLKPISIPQNDLLILWYQNSPWNEAMRSRLKQGHRVSERDRRQSWNTPLMPQVVLDTFHERLARQARDLSRDPVFIANTKPFI